MYMPPSKQFQDQRGKLIPPKSKYSIRIEAPREMGLLPYVGQIENGRETTVVMESPGNFHTFTFVDEYGVIDDPEGLEKVNLIIDPLREGLAQEKLVALPSSKSNCTMRSEPGVSLPISPMLPM